MIEVLNNFAQDHAWIGMTVAIFIAIHTGLKALRDAIDTTPQSDDNWFERIVTILGKITSYFAGFRAKKNP